MRTLGALTCALLLSACSLFGADQKKAPADQALMSAGPMVAEGVSATNAVTDFSCAADEAGVWRAQGVVTNTAERSATFQVTVFRGSGSGAGVTQRLERVKPKSTAPFEFESVPGTADDKTCHVHVVIPAD